MLQRPAFQRRADAATMICRAGTGHTGGAMSVLDILCVLFLLGILQSRWVLNVISALAILLHTALALFGFVQKRTVVVWVSLLLLIGYTGNFIYYNLEWLKGLISL